ncbi:SMP-30/gluconolactonase/LRE family protein, partial [Streptomyces vinaceus]
MPDLVVRGTGRDDMAELSGGGEPGSVVRSGSRRGRMARRGLVSAAMVAAMITGGGIATIGEALAADLPSNIVCPQIDVCSVVATGLASASGVVVDDDGGSYVGTAGGVLYKVSPGGVKTQIAAGIGDMRGLARDDDGNFYSGLYNSGALRKVTPSGVVTTLATGFGNAWGVAVDGDENVYVTNYQGGGLWKVTPGGVKTQIAADLGFAMGLARDDMGNFFVSTETGVLWKVAPNGVKTQITTGLGRAVGAAVDGEGNPYVVNETGVLWRVSPNGVKETVATNIGTGQAKGTFAALDSNGNAYVTSFSGGTLWSLPGVGVPLNQAPAAPSIAAPKPNAETGAYPVFKGHALAENGSVDADEVQILDANGIILDKVDVRQSDGYFSWKQNGKWEPGPHELKFVSIRGDLKSDATVLKFTVAPGPVAPVVTKPTDN